MSHKKRQKAIEVTEINQEIALKLVGKGLAIIPASAVTKRPLIRDWRNAAATTIEEVRRLWNDHPDAVPAILTGPKSGVTVIDLDVGHGDGRDGFAALEVMGLSPNQLSHVRVETPSGGLHAYVLGEAGITNAASHLPHGIDKRGDGGYAIAPGSVMADGRSYRYLTRATLEDDVIGLPPMPAALRAPDRKERDADNDNDDPDLSRRDVRAIAREFAENNDIEKRDPWLKLGMALNDWCDGNDEGLGIWGEISKETDFYQRNPKQASRELEEQWKSFDRTYSGDPITIASLIIDAPEWDYQRKLRDFRAEIDDEDSDWQEKNIAEEKKVAPASPLVMLTPDACDVGKFSNYVVKGLFGAGEIGTIVGAPGVGKSALAASMAYSVAQGDLTFGMRTREGPVFYLACENETDMKRRVKALRDNRGAAENFRLVLGGGGNLKAGSKFHRALLKQIERDRPVLVVIDTLAAAMPGFEENSSEGMGQAIAVAKSLGKFGAAVVVVHHDTKAGDGLPRGHSSLNGIVDVNLALRRNDDGIITGECSKNRSGKSHEQIVAYENRVVELGFDQDGDAITTVICEETETSQRKPEAVSKSGALALRILKDCMQGASAVSLNVWRDACMEDPWLKSYDKHDTRRKTFRRAKEDLEEAAHIAIDGENVRVIDPNRADVEVEEFGPRVVRRSNRHREIEGLA